MFLLLELAHRAQERAREQHLRAKPDDITAIVVEV